MEKEIEGNKPHIKEIMVVKTTEWFRLKKKIFKWILITIGVILLLIFLTYVFGVYFFLSFIIWALLITPLFYKILESTGEIYLECKVGKNKDSIGISKIPHNIVRQIEMIGGNTTKFKTIAGHTLNIVEEIDYNNLIIKKAWFDEMSSFEFFCDKKAFDNLRDNVLNLMDEIFLSKRLRPIYNKAQFIKMFNDQEYEKEIKNLDQMGSIENVPTKQTEK
jgi:hypothetical protein